MTEEFKKEIALENEKKKDKAQKTFQGNQHVDCTPIGGHSKIDGRKDTWTDSQTAKKAGVGVGTVARYNRVMNSDDESKQRKVAVEYVKLCGYGQGRPEKDANLARLSLDQIAEQLGTSKAMLNL